MSDQQIIVTVSGVDKVGIVAKVTTALAQYEVNIEDIKQTLLSIKNMNSNELKLLREKTFATINKYTSESCGIQYLDEIFKFL